MKTFQLEDLPNLVPAFSKSQSLFYKEVCIAALESQNHVSGILLRLNGEFNEEIQMSWERQLEKIGINEPRDLAEFGALAVAIFVVKNYSEYEVVEQSVIGTGFDYWLSYKLTESNYDAENFLNARLEVSGILAGDRRDVSARLRQKIRQTGISDYLNIPAIIVVVEFSAPSTTIFVK